MRSGKREAAPQRRPVQRIEGHTFWTRKEPSPPAELISRDELHLGDDEARWIVHALSGSPYGLPIESTSPAVRHFLRRVVATKERIAHRHAAISPVPKPGKPRRRRRSPAEPFVSCPLCRPEGGSVEPWPNCEVCRGEGTISLEEAEAWREAIG